MRRLPRGSHLKCFTAFVTYTSSRGMPASASALSSIAPAGPTKGAPCRSSWSPGCSPTNMTRAVLGPAPNTTCVAVRYRSHPRQLRAASLKTRRLVLSGTNGAADCSREAASTSSSRSATFLAIRCCSVHFSRQRTPLSLRFTKVGNWTREGEQTTEVNGGVRTYTIRPCKISD